MSEDHSAAQVAAPAPAPPARHYPPPGRPEAPWPAGLAVLAAIILQFTLPDRLVLRPHWLVPALETALLIGLVFATPMQLEHEHPRRRAASLILTAFVSVANIVSLGLLTHLLLHHGTPAGHQLIVAGSLIWITNVLIFGLWYWETDRGGAGRRAAGHDGAPDFLFVQMTDDSIHDPYWRPVFVDYLYLSLTNAAAFSPTDTLPLTARAKAIMGVQSVVSLVTIGLIVSRAVNILS